MSKVTPWPNPTGRPEELPRRIKRPAEHGLWLAARNLEIQLGTIEAYNRLVDTAAELKRKIDAGKAEAQHPLFAKSIRGEPD